MDCLDLLAVQGTLKSLFQHQFKNINSSVLCFLYSPTLSPYMTTGKTITLTRWNLVGKVMFLLFNVLSRLVMVFLPKGKHLLISWLQSPSAVILESKRLTLSLFSMKSVTVSPSICHEVMGPDAMILAFWMLSFKSNFHSPLLVSSRGSLFLLHFQP